MKKNQLFFLVLLCSVSALFGQNDLSGPVVQLPVYFDVSPPLTDMVKSLPTQAETSWKDGIVKNKFNVRQRPVAKTPGGLTDPFLQTMDGMTLTDTTLMNFDGNSNTQGYTPPDTHGDVGPNHYFQVVNCHYSIYSKTGALLLGPLMNNTIFTGMTNNSNDGDAVVLYDEQADRWVFSQFSLPNYPAGPFYQMIAVSTTPNPTGTWYRYQYSFTNMPDYPKFGVWGDGYYMSMHMFTATAGNFAGEGAVAYNRALMLAGSPAATMVMFTKSSSTEFGWLPSDCDGPFPAGNPPNYFLYAYDGSSNDNLGIYEFHVDWNTTANSTLTNFLSLPVNAFTTNITGITQPGTTAKLDVLNDRTMYRLQYRNFGGYSTLVCNHTIDISTTVAGIRWYELRKTTGAWSIYQQGTYSPADNNSRWMGSIAMDSSGNIALGYSVSGTTLYPSIRYCGRKKNDVLNQMTIAERGIFNGGGSQTDAGHRWGDYSAMSCDPSAKATFWYTQMYYASTSGTSWRTRIASFRFAIPPGVTTLAASPVAATSATLNALVNPNTVATNYHFEWGTSASYGNVTATGSAGSGGSAVAVNASLASLGTGTTYHFRIVATSINGTSYGDDLTFIPGGAIVTTTIPSVITTNSAVSGGTVSADGGLSVTARGVCWAATANPTISANHTTDGAGTGTFTSNITGLLPSTIYHVRAYATNSNNTFYGEDLTFTASCTFISAFPWNEGFENGGLIPGCWTQEQVNNSGISWIFITGNGTGYPLAAHGGTYNACLKDVSTADNKTILITPALSLTAVVSPQLKFWYTLTPYSGRQDQLAVYCKTSLGGTWTLLASYTTSITAWTQVTLSLPSPSGDYYVGFQGNAKYGRGVCIDDVEVSSSCATILPVGISIVPSANPVCQGSGVTLTATPANGGATPVYQWKVNGANAGSNSPVFAYTPASGDQVTCVLTSNATCISGNPATSNAVGIIANPVLPVSVSIVASANPVEQGTAVAYTASAVNGGASPSYQWKVNAANAGINNELFTYTPGNGDVVSCTLTSGESCTSGNPAVSNSISMVVNSVPVTLDLLGNVVSATECFNALQTISVAGNGHSFTVPVGGNATMIAGQNILYYPGTIVAEGGYLYGYIAPAGPWCQAPAFPVTISGIDDTPQESGKQFYRIYPNPTQGDLLIEMIGTVADEISLVEIYDMKGKKVVSSVNSGRKQMGLSLSGNPPGIYLVRVISEKNSGTSRILKL